MTRDAVIAILRAHEAPLRRQGVTRAALFGSTARGESPSESDLDIMVEIDPAARVDLYDYVADRTMLIEPVPRTAERDATYAF